jgi:hypothetical protein
MATGDGDPSFVEVAGKQIHDADIVATMQVYRIRHR